MHCLALYLLSLADHRFYFACVSAQCVSVCVHVCVRIVCLFIHVHLVAVARQRSLQPCGACGAGVVRVRRAMADSQLTYGDIPSSGVRMRCKRVAQRMTALIGSFHCVYRTSQHHCSADDRTECVDVPL